MFAQPDVEVVEAGPLHRSLNEIGIDCGIAVRSSGPVFFLLREPVALFVSGALFFKVLPWSLVVGAVDFPVAAAHVISEPFACFHVNVWHERSSSAGGADALAFVSGAVFQTVSVLFVVVVHCFSVCYQVNSELEVEVVFLVERNICVFTAVSPVPLCSTLSTFLFLWNTRNIRGLRYLCLCSVSTLFHPSGVEQFLQVAVHRRMAQTEFCCY